MHSLLRMYKSLPHQSAALRRSPRGAHIAPFSTLYKSTQLLCLNPLTLKSSYERWNSVIPIFCGLVDYSIFWDCSVCNVSERAVAVLVSGNSGGNVPGRNPGTFQILFYQDHTCRENRRIFWTYGHMWERCFLGTIVISLVSQLTGQVNIGVGAISLFFILGMIVFKMSTAEAGSM